MKSVLESLFQSKSLTRSEAKRAMQLMVDGDCTQEQVGAFLTALRIKGETAEEILGFTDCLKEKALPMRCDGGGLIDVCGTGGDRSGTFNVSTAVALVLAAAGLRVAKHGNRSVSSQTGSSDVLEALGVGFHSNAAEAESSLDRHGLAFLFAQAFHPALGRLAPIRRGLGFYTVFNVLGPLLNPAPVERQMIGVYSPVLQEKIAKVLLERGMRDAMIVHGSDGLDEITLSGPTRVIRIQGGVVRELTVSPEDFGLSMAPLSEVQGGDPAENARILIGIFEGQPGPKRDLVLANAGAAFVLSGQVNKFRDGAQLAAQTIDQRKVSQLLARMSEDRKAAAPG